MNQVKSSFRLHPGQDGYPWRVFFGYLGAAVVFRYICHSLMLIPVLLNELRPAPTVRGGVPTSMRRTS